MDSKKPIPPGSKKEISKKQDIIKKNIAQAKLPRNKSKENSKVLPEKPVSRTKSQKVIKSNENSKSKSNLNSSLSNKSTKNSKPPQETKLIEKKPQQIKKKEGKK